MNMIVCPDKTIKLMDVGFISGKGSGFDRKYHEMDYTTPLSPQAMGSLILGPKVGAKFDKEKNDVWSLGKV
jgi:hypothetical protein